MKYNDLMDILGKNKKRNKDIDDNRYVDKMFKDMNITHIKNERRKNK